MAFQTGGKPANTGAPGPTPPPTQKQSATDARSTSFGRTSYGANAWNGRVVDDPGKRTRAGLTVNNDDTDAALALVRQHGTAGGPIGAAQDGVVRAKSLPTSHGLHPANDGPRSGGDPAVPGILDKGADGQPVRKPG